MPTHSEFQEKIDVLDIIISILREHEETLSRLADRFDAVCGDVSTFEEKLTALDRSLERLDRINVRTVVGAVGLKGPLVTVRCKDWVAFRTASQGALLVAFEATDDRLLISSISDLFVFAYSDGLPEAKRLFDASARRGLKGSSRAEDLGTDSSRGTLLEDGESVCQLVLGPKMVKRWLSSELGVPEKRIVEGRVLR